MAEGVITVPLAPLGVVTFATDSVALYGLLELALPAVPLEIGSVELDSGNGGNEDVSGDEDDTELGDPVTAGEVTLAADIGTVELGTGNGGDTGADV